MKTTFLLIYSLFFLGIVTIKAQYKVLLDFNGTNGAYPLNNLTLSGNKLYGMTGGGAYNYGNIFSIDSSGGGYKDIVDFNASDNVIPIGSLTLSGNVLYGERFSIDTNGKELTHLLAYNWTNGSNPTISLTLSGNRLYGMTTNGGANDYGCIFSIDTTGNRYKDLHDFDSIHGKSPNGSLILSGNILYGMTTYGGANNSGCIFSIDTTGIGYTDLFDFNGTDGAHPKGNLILSGGLLFGMTYDGGTNNVGVIFYVNTNGSGYTDLFDFNNTLGANPYGSLTLSGNKLYGMTFGGGAYSSGCIFSVGGGYYTDLFDFNGPISGSQLGVNGINPDGSLTISGNKLYGMTACNVFSIDTNGSGYKDLFLFDSSQGTYPSSVSCSLTLSGSLLYGYYGNGPIFSIDTNGERFTTVFNFNGTNVGRTIGSLILSGNNLYGIVSSTLYDSTSGTVFSFNTNSSDYKDLLDFNPALIYTKNAGNTALTSGSLTPSGNNLYGMSYYQGANDDGFIFSINPSNGSGYTDLFDFNGSNGQFPEGSLTLSGSVLYGMTYAGGVHDDGCIFSINTNGTGYTDLFDFNGTSNGANPYGNLTLSGSVLYGMTSAGGTKGDGCIFSVNTNGTGYMDLLDFNGINGAEPYGSLTLSGNVLYGMISRGGSQDSGCIFSINTNGSGYTDLFDFSSTNGANPWGSLILSGNVLYGMTSTGGTNGDGVIFSFNTVPTGINNITVSASGANVYPNPNTGNFTITGLTQGQVIELYNYLGQKLSSSIADNTAMYFNISGEANGMYLIRIVNQDGSLVTQKKIVKIQ